ncbi:MAG: toll/interleukin-1 receptor domain-containing protein [Alphaproteobacteria bacterium]|nr:toll/interleukin-1 receptor domain-containing protein [Alphaproteobacteria bacterium]
MRKTASVVGDTGHVRVFISYHTPDLDKARAVEAGLARRAPATECYLAPRSNVGGAYWLPRLSDEIACSDAVLFLAGARVGPWQELEYYETLRLNREHGGRPRLVPVLIAGHAPGLPFFNQLHHINAPDAVGEDGLLAIERAVAEAPVVDARPAWTRFQPYKGLPALQESDAAFFFGREAETAEVLDLIAHRPQRIIALLGQSGVGKSSLARAGVLAALRSQSWPAAGGTWPATLGNSRAFLPLIVRAGDAPLKELALAFAQLYRSDPADIEKEARGWEENFRAGSGLRDLLRVSRDHIAEALGAEPPTRFVLYLDQAEELYAGGDANASGLLSRLLAEAADHEAFSVLLSLRSDYYPAYQNDSDLFHASERVDILPLRRDVLTDIVVRPAASLGARFESEDMAARVAAATARQPGALPLLADLMHDLWLNMQERGDGVLRWADNPEIIDIGAPLRRRAEAFLARRAGEEKALRRLFTLHFANVPQLGEPVPRRARYGECSTEEWRLAEALAEPQWRLVTLSRTGNGEPVAEVAHDQLLRSWPRLTAWLDEEREFLLWRGPVESEAEGRDPELLAGRRLAVARGWYERREGDLAPALRAFIAASIAADERRIIAERRRRRFILSTISAGLVVALVFAGIAGWQWRVAGTERTVAESQTLEAKAQRDRAEQNLALATQTVNALVFDLAQKFKYSGLPANVITDILNRARQLLDQLAAGGQISADLLHIRAAALDEMAKMLLKVGDRRGALDAAMQSRDILKALVQKNPWNTSVQRDLSVSYDSIGDVLEAQGDLAGALVAYRDSLAIRQARTQKYPGDIQPQRDLALSDENIGDALQAQGDLAGALAAYRDSLAIRQALAKKDLGDNDEQRGLAFAEARVGEALRAQGDLAAAIAQYRDCQSIMVILVRKEPSNTLWQHGLAHSDLSIGDILEEQGDLASAIAQYRDSQTIMKALVQKDPANTEWERGLAAGDERIGDVLQAQGDAAGALAAYRDSLATRRTLAQKDPGNTEWQRELAVSDNKIGDVLRAQGDLARALVAYHEDLVIAEALAQKDPGNAGWQHHLASALGDLAWTLVLDNQPQDALAAVNEALTHDPSLFWLQGNKADALLLLGRFEEAKAIYLGNKDKPINGKTFAEVVREDFAEMRKFGIDTPDMKRIEELLAS